MAKTHSKSASAASALPPPLPSPAARAGEQSRELVHAVLNMVPLDMVLDVLTDRVRAANRSDQLLATLALRGEQAKPTIEARSGASLSTEQAGELLKRTSETVRTHVAKNRLVGYDAMGDRTRLRLPMWQFDAQGSVHPWVPELIDAFGANGWGLLDFVTVPRGTLSEGNYLHLLLNGRAGEVIAIAKRSNPD